MEGLRSKRFTEMNTEETIEVNGGGVGLAIAGGVLLVAGTLAVDEYIERRTGKDIAGHVGDGIKAIGGALESWGSSLIN